MGTNFSKAPTMDLKTISTKIENVPIHNSSETKITDLPDEVLELIFLKMSQQDIHRNMVLVCQRFKNIIYQRKFAPIVKIDNAYVSDISVFEKVEKAMKIYPNSKIEVLYYIRAGLCGYSWGLKLAEFSPYISKLNMSCRKDDFGGLLILQKIKNLNNLEVLERFDLNHRSVGGRFPIVEIIDMICSACPNLTNFEYKCISKSRYYVTTDIAWVSKDSTLCEEPKFQRLTYIKITVCGKMFHYDDKLEADMDTFKNYLSSKCPKLENPIQFKPYCVGTWKVGEFSSCDF